MIASCRSAVRKNPIHQRRNVSGILCLIKDACPIHGRRHGGRCVGEHRYFHVERFDQRHAEPFVLAGTQKEIGDLVEGNQLLVRHVTDEMHVIGTERSGEVVERREIPFESRVSADDDQP